MEINDLRVKLQDTNLESKLEIFQEFLNLKKEIESLQNDNQRLSTENAKVLEENKQMILSTPTEVINNVENSEDELSMESLIEKLKE